MTMRPIPVIDRRRFLGLLGSAGALGALGCGPAAVRPTAERAAPQATSAVPNADRTLVVIELRGGNDGLAMLQPIGSADADRLRAVRPDLMAAGDDLHVVAGSGFGWHPNLGRLAEIGVAGLVGVGSERPDFSHFEMEQRWWRGDSSERSRETTGFLGRLCDELDVGAPVTGLSVGGGPTPALLSRKAVTVGLSDPGAHWFFGEADPWLDSYRAATAAMAMPSVGDTSAVAAARAGLANMGRFAESIAELGPGDDDRYPWTGLGQQLRVAADVMRLDAGIRVIHAQLDGFDTHTGQSWRHDELMTELDKAVAVFVGDLAEQGRVEDTLIVTMSEFGRRVEQNDGGTDHGGASTMLICGSDPTGIHGQAPDLAALDDGNLVATARFEDYYATIAERWLGVPAASVLDHGTAIAELLG